MVGQIYICPDAIYIQLRLGLTMRDGKSKIPVAFVKQKSMSLLCGFHIEEGQIWYPKYMVCPGLSFCGFLALLCVGFTLNVRWPLKCQSLYLYLSQQEERQKKKNTFSVFQKAIHYTSR